MLGRFFTPVILLGVLKFKYLSFKNNFQNVTITSLIFVFLISLNIYLNNSNYRFIADGGFWGTFGVNDERRVYFSNRNLSNAISIPLKDKKINWNFNKITNIEIIEGMHSIDTIDFGPNIYVLDFYSLNQALIARVPTNNNSFLPGHIVRKIPTGYIASIKSGKNLIKNKEIHDYYDHILRVTTGKLNSYERFKSIFYLNFVKRKIDKNILSAKDY